MRTTIAWVLAPNTKEMQRQEITPRVKAILEKENQIRVFHSLVLAQAKKIAAIYNKSGLEAIKDEKIKARLKIWENKWKNKTV